MCAGRSAVGATRFTIAVKPVKRQPGLSTRRRAMQTDVEFSRPICGMQVDVMTRLYCAPELPYPKHAHAHMYALCDAAQIEMPVLALRL